jgi:TolA-binding protein
MLRETMDCQRIAEGELVEQYLNGRLDPALQDDLEVHLLSCPQCLAHAETLKAIRAGLATAPQGARESAVRKFWSPGWGRVAAAAAVLILVAAGIYLFRQSSRKPAQTANTPTEAPSNTPVVPKSRNEAGSEQHASDHPAPKPERKNPRPEKKPDRDSREVQGPKITPETQVATNHPTPAPSSPPGNVRKEPTSSGMSEEDAVELYRLAAVQAPPYTFNQPGGSGPGTAQGAKPSSSFSSMTGPGRAFFQQAMLAYVEGHYQDAAQLLEKTVQSQPRAAPANFYLGVCRLLQGHPSASVAPLKEVLAAPASSFTQSAHFYLAKAYLQMSQLEDAEREMQAAANLSGNLTAEAQSLSARIHALRDHANRLPN